ncbi:MAG: NAD-binding protein [Anaerolineae bacterium]|nr:NAD-binding protein [Anaerolineae bacterium]
MATWERAGAQESTLLVAMTGKDEVNLTVALLGRHQFSIPQIVARVNNSKNAWLFTPDMGGGIKHSTRPMCLPNPSRLEKRRKAQKAAPVPQGFSITAQKFTTASGVWS